MKDRHLLFKYLFGLTVCILFFPLAVSAADSFIHFKRLSVDDGLSQNTVLALTQDHNNKLWVGTIDGLNWYEGSRFVSYYKARMIRPVWQTIMSIHFIPIRKVRYG